MHTSHSFIQFQIYVITWNKIKNIYYGFDFKVDIWITLEINEVQVCCNNVPSQQKIIQISKENVI